MARWSVAVQSITPVAVADNTNYTDAGYLAVQGGSSTQRTNFLEVYMGGLATSSAPSQMLIARDSTVGASSLSGGLFSALDPASAALAAPPLQFHTSTTKPKRSTTLTLLTLAFNAFGGIVRWVAAPGEEVGMLGNTASLGEISLSSGASGSPGLMAAHMIIEVF